MYQNIEVIDYKEETEDIIRKFECKEDFVYYTSGSTGAPKKIVHSYELMKMVAEENCRYNNYVKDDYIVNMSLPAASIGYPVLSVLPALISGCKLKVRAFNPYDYLEEIKEATHAFILPAVYRVLKKTTKWITFNFTGMTISCGADIVPEGIKEDVMSKGAIKFHHLYGSTEVPPAISDSEDERQIGQNLSPLIDYYVEEDELFIKWKGQDSYWQSGDVVDEQLRVTGRKKNVLALNCSRIQPETIERYVLDNTGVNRCMLTIKKDKVWMFFDGDEIEMNVKNKVEEWYKDTSVNVKKVNKIKVNKMNKLIRTENYI
jgi:acyl-coenzyme A synthetase/AMP-(fatty) acid ligase